MVRINENLRAAKAKAGEREWVEGIHSDNVRTKKPSVPEKRQGSELAALLKRLEEENYPTDTEIGKLSKDMPQTLGKISLRVHAILKEKDIPKGKEMSGEGILLQEAKKFWDRLQYRKGRTGFLFAGLNSMWKYFLKESVSKHLTRLIAAEKKLG